MDAPILPRKPYWTWERLARIAIFTQVAITVAIAAYFAVVTDQQNAVLAEQAITSAASNAAIIAEVREDLIIHAHASADRACATAEELRFLVNQAPEISQRILDKVERFTEGACLYVPPHVSSLSTVHH